MEILEAIEDLRGVPYPTPPAGLLTFAISDMDLGACWQRIEAYCAYRWSVRPVRWTVMGPGEFRPDLAPAVMTSQEVWDGSAWILASLPATPLGGFELTGEGPYRITADVGTTDVPAAVWEAFRRLAEYSTDIEERAGATDYTAKVGGEIEESFSRYPSWLARAIQYSGAADLLRPYRRV